MIQHGESELSCNLEMYLNVQCCRIQTKYCRSQYDLDWDRVDVSGNDILR